MAPDRRVFTGDLPPEVISCLNHARFLHLATCNSTLRPHVALMNYTYLPPTKTFTGSSLPSVVASASSAGVIIMSFSPTTRKLANITANPHVSLLVHDWASSRPPGATQNQESTSPSAPQLQGNSSLSPLTQFLQNLNSSELQSYSHTIRGFARILESGSEEEKYYREAHKIANRFEDAKCYVEGEEGSAVVVVEVEGGKIADWKGAVEDWGIPEDEEEAGGVSVPVNGA
ncbi:hypothetical protein ABW21_db0206198 [Orbilia brochopaga]|nr:hypothetical protein ABW21_db0206198 [Drechslerella brochopaga]